MVGGVKEGKMQLTVLNALLFKKLPNGLLCSMLEKILLFIVLKYVEFVGSPLGVGMSSENNV